MDGVRKSFWVCDANIFIPDSVGRWHFNQLFKGGFYGICKTLF